MTIKNFTDKNGKAEYSIINPENSKMFYCVRAGEYCDIEFAFSRNYTMEAAIEAVKYNAWKNGIEIDF